MMLELPCSFRVSQSRVHHRRQWERNETKRECNVCMAKLNRIISFI